MHGMGRVVPNLDLSATKLATEVKKVLAPCPLTAGICRASPLQDRGLIWPRIRWGCPERSFPYRPPSPRVLPKRN